MESREKNAILLSAMNFREFILKLRRTALELGERLRKVRLMKGMTQEELAKRVHCTRAAISNYEKHGINNLDTIYILSEALEVDLLNVDVGLIDV